MRALLDGLLLKSMKHTPPCHRQAAAQGTEGSHCPYDSCISFHLHKGDSCAIPVGTHVS